MKQNYSIIILLIAFIAYAKDVPSTNIIIQNNSACSLELVYLQNFTAKLSLPEKIEPYSVLNGHIKFDNSFISTNQQEATGQYILSCDTKKSIISLSFYIGNDHIDEYNYFFEAQGDHNSPVLILPFGKTIVTNTLPVMVSFLDKEDKTDEEPNVHNTINDLDKEIPSDTTRDNEPSYSTSTDGDSEGPEQNALHN